MVRMPPKVMSSSDTVLAPLNTPVQALLSDMIRSFGEDPHREGLLKTPERFEKAMRELTAGYHLTPKEVVGDGIFQAEGSGVVTVKEIEFFSLCEHHLLPFWGTASIGYLPGEKILGLSKLARIVEVFARRLQVQERLTKEIAQAISELVSPRAVFVTVEASHMCMMMRGVRKVNSMTLTEYGIGLDSIPAMERERLLSSCSR